MSAVTQQEVVRQRRRLLDRVQASVPGDGILNVGEHTCGSQRRRRGRLLGGCYKKRRWEKDGGPISHSKQKYLAVRVPDRGTTSRRSRDILLPLVLGKGICEPITTSWQFRLR